MLLEFSCSNHKSIQKEILFSALAGTDDTHKEKLIPFLLYLPIKAFLRPTIYYEGNIENEINKRIKEYFNRFVTIDKKNYLCCCDLLFKFNSNIFLKELKKFEPFFKPELFNAIKNKKYKKFIQQKIPWQLNFDDLIFNGACD